MHKCWLWALGTLCLAASFCTAQTLLWDNGPFITGTGNGAGGADTSAIETGYNAYGYNWSNTVPFYIADDFTVGDFGWQLSHLIWRGYQTGSSTNSSFTDLFVEIWDGPPGLGGSKIYGDQSTNRLTSGAWSGVYRVSSDPLNSARPIMDLQADMSWCPSLPTGTYWLVVSAKGTVNSGPWANPVVPHRETDNARQWNGSAWNQIDGNGTGAGAPVQDMPFMLYGDILSSTEYVYPDDAQVMKGTYNSGDLTSFTADDDNYYVVGAQYDPTDPLAVINASVRLIGHASGASYSSGNFKIIEKCNTTQAKYRVRANKAAGGFATLVDGVATAFTETTFDNPLPAPVNDFIDAANGNMMSCDARAASNNKLAGFFRYSIELAEWALTP